MLLVTVIPRYKYFAEHFPSLGYVGNGQNVFICDADAEPFA